MAKLEIVSRAPVRQTKDNYLIIQVPVSGNRRRGSVAAGIGRGSLGGNKNLG